MSHTTPSLSTPFYEAYLCNSKKMFTIVCELETALIPCYQYSLPCSIVTNRSARIAIHMVGMTIAKDGLMIHLPHQHFDRFTKVHYSVKSPYTTTTSYQVFFCFDTSIENTLELNFFFPMVVSLKKKKPIILIFHQKG